MASISVVICTRNRASKLPALFDSLSAAAEPFQSPCEVLVVDNDSRDGTADTVHDWAGRSRVPCRYVFEGRPGKGHALNAGVRLASREVVAFTDDDIVVARDWFVRLGAAFDDDPGLDGLGGRVELHDPACLPVAIRTSRTRDTLARHRFAVQNPQIIGCNMAFRRGALERAGLFDEEFGPGSRLRVTFEEADLIYRLLRDGARIEYVPDVVVYHDHGRRPGDDLSSLIEGYTRGRGAFYWKHGVTGDRFVLRSAYWEVRGALAACAFDFARGRLPRPALAQLRALAGGALAYARRGPATRA